MIKLVTSNKVEQPRDGWIMHPEIQIGMNKLFKYMEKKAREKEVITIYSANPIVFRIGILLKLRGEKVWFYYLGRKMEEVILDDLGYFVNSPAHFLDMMEKIQMDIVDIRNERRRYAESKDNC